MLGAVGAVACGPKHGVGPDASSPGTRRPEQDPRWWSCFLTRTPVSPDGANVANPFGSVDLGAKYDATSATPSRRPDAVSTLSEADVNRIFGDALSALPPPLQHFTLFFRFESDELTDESRALLRKVVNAVRGRAAPDIAIVGHTDTKGTSSANFQLGLKRSTAVRALLVAAGLDPSVVEVTSHGEADLLIQTARRDGRASQSPRRDFCEVATSL